MAARQLWIFIAMAFPLAAAEHHGTVKFGGLPVPGATVTAAAGEKSLTAVTDSQGVYSFADLADGVWSMQVAMPCFATLKRDVTVAANHPAEEWDLKLLPFDEIKAAATVVATPAAPPPPPTSNAAALSDQPAPKAAKPNAAPEPKDAPGEAADEMSQKASDGFLINGSVNNGAASPFAQAMAFGNNRRGARGLYNGGIGFTVDNSAFDAQSFSLTGQDTPKPPYNRITGLLSLGGPLKIPHLLQNGPLFVLNYQWTRNRTTFTTPGLVPAAAERNGDLSPIPTAIIDPTNGAPFAGNQIPLTRLNSQAQALLALYPLPNFTGSSRYNYQVPLVNVQHQDSMQTRLNKTIGNKNQVSGSFAFQSTRADSPNLLGFLDTTDTLGINSQVNWRHTFTTRLFGNLGFQYSLLTTQVTPFFDNRENISGAAGIAGNNQDPLNWGPPALNFASGIAPVSDAQQAHNRNQTAALSETMNWFRGRHNVTFGGDFKRLEYNYLSQQDPRGTLNFTGAATGSDLADFLLGTPDTASIAFGNADKYFRTSSYDAYITDDWRVSPELTVNYGMRWEYSAPIVEKYGRLVNLDLAPGFTSEAPVVAAHPEGAITGQNYPDSLIHPDKGGFEPRVGVAWRPISGSSMLIRAGYGLYFNSSVYQNIAIQMAQQAPLSKSLSVSNSAQNPLTLANPFLASPTTTPNTFAVDPNFRVGYAHNWNFSVQRDLPGGLVVLGTYNGIKGTRGMQEFLPNTYPIGAVNPCPSCPYGYYYLASNGNSTRESGQFQLRRRLHNGITATLQYTYSKSIDDSALGGRGQAVNVIAQNWLDLSAERGLSSFDQRHLVNLQAQYTSGMGMHGGALLTGWRGALFKEWTIASQINAGTGLPLTPVYFAAVPGTGVAGPIRADYTGASVYAAPSGLFLNPAAYAPPASGQWGDAGRDSITGPVQFSLNASLGRTFRLNDRLNLDLRVDSANALNHVTYPSWNTTITSAQFGLPMTTNAMRTLQTTLRVRF